MYLVQSLRIESSNRGLLVERPVTKPLESTWTDWGFLPSPFWHCISSSTTFFEAHWALHMLLVWRLMGEVICAPLLAPKLGLEMLLNEGQFVQLEQGALVHMAHLGCHEKDPCSRM